MLALVELAGATRNLYMLGYDFYMKLSKGRGEVRLLKLLFKEKRAFHEICLFREKPTAIVMGYNANRVDAGASKQVTQGKRQARYRKKKQP